MASGPATCWTVCERVEREWSVCRCGKNYVCSEAAEFFVEFLVEIGVEGEECSGYARGDGHCDERGDAAGAAMDESERREDAGQA